MLLFALVCGRSMLPRPDIDGRPTPATPLRFAVAGVMWLITGREKLRAGAADPRPAPPAIVVRVGLTSGARTAEVLTRLSWFGATRTELRDTDSEFTSVLREAAVNPLGACMFA